MKKKRKVHGIDKEELEKKREHELRIRYFHAFANSLKCCNHKN